MEEFYVELLIAYTDKTWDTEIVYLSEEDYHSENFEEIASKKFLSNYKKDNIALVSLYSMHG